MSIAKLATRPMADLCVSCPSSFCISRRQIPSFLHVSYRALLFHTYFHLLTKKTKCCDKSNILIDMLCKHTDLYRRRLDVWYVDFHSRALMLCCVRRYIGPDRSLHVDLVESSEQHNEYLTIYPTVSFLRKQVPLERITTTSILYSRFSS